MKKNKLTALDFFCGGGGFSEGLLQAGVDVVRAFDHWAPAVKTHQMNHPDTEVLNKDILEIAYLPEDEFEEIVPDTDIIVGSPPCVAFSNSNKSGNGDKTLGVQLLEAYLTIIARKKFKKDSTLKYWVLENVPNVQNYISKTKTFDEEYVKGTLSIKNSTSGTYKMNEYGVPSTRQRYFCGEFPEPKKSSNNPLTVKEVKKILSSSNIITDPFTKLEIPEKEITDKNYQYLLADFEWEKAKRQKQDKGYMGKMSFPENEDKPSRTVMATLSKSSRESMIYMTEEGNYRLPTVRELATFMSFPIDYRFYGNTVSVKHKLVGNAVPPLFSYLLGCSMMEQSGLQIPPKMFPKIWHEQHNKEFVNLNGKQFPLNIEKVKRFGVQYKYHIPYMIINSYRVELNCSIKNEEPVWSSIIHKGQGANKIEITELPNLNEYITQNYNKEILDEFIQRTFLKYKNFQNLYEQYLLPKNKRLFGPDELLVCIKEFMDANIFETKEFVSNNLKIPSEIVVGFYLLKNVLEVER